MSPSYQQVILLVLSSSTNLKIFELLNFTLTLAHKQFLQKDNHQLLQ